MTILWFFKTSFLKITELKCLNQSMPYVIPLFIPHDESQPPKHCFEIVFWLFGCFLLQLIIV